MNRPVALFEIRLPGNDDFSEKFNRVSELYSQYNDDSISDEEKERRFDEFFRAKCCLEMGINF